MIKFGRAASVLAKTNIKAFVFTSVFAFAGVATFLLTKASTPTIQLEPEDGATTSDVIVVDNTTASKGKYVRFDVGQNTDSGIKFKLFSPAWRGLGDMTDTTRLRHFTEIIGNQNPTTIHNLIPGSTVYKYSLGPYVTAPYVPCSLRPPTYNQATLPDHTANPDYNPKLSKCGTSALPDSALAKDSRGYTTWAKNFNNNFLVNTDDPSWLSYVRNTLTTNQVTFSSGNLYDGLLSDSMGTAPICSNYLIAKPVGWSCDTSNNVAIWLTANRQTLLAKSSVLGPLNKKLIMNGLGNGDNYWSTLQQTKLLLSDSGTNTVTGAMAELIFRSPSSPLSTYPALDSWLNDIHMIEDVENTYHINGYWWSKCWSAPGDNDPPTCNDDGNPAGIDQWRRFAISSYLLAAGPHSYFNWDQDENDGNAAEYYSDYDHAAAISWATGTRTVVTGLSDVYSRRYHNGIVYVNPNDTLATITLPTGSYQEFDGSTVSGTLDLAAHSGEILVQQ